MLEEVVFETFPIPSYKIGYSQKKGVEGLPFIISRGSEEKAVLFCTKVYTIIEKSFRSIAVLLLRMFELL